MSTSVSGIGSSNATMMHGMPGRRPNPAQMAENLFSRLDTAGQGYIEKADLQAAFDKISSTSSSTSSSDVDDMFSKFDTDSDGKVTRQEFSDTLRKVSEQLDNQAMSTRVSGGMGGMPPPPGTESGDSGFTKEELSDQLQEIGDSDSKRSTLISNIVNNFEKADTDGDGKVSFKEAMAYDKGSSSSSRSTNSADTSSSTTSSKDLSSQVLQQIMKLLQAYNIGGDSGDSSVSSLSVTA